MHINNFCCHLLSSVVPVLSDRYLKTWNGTTGFVLNKPWNRHHHDSITEMLQELNWPSLQQRRKQARLILLYKIVNNLLFVPSHCLPSLNLSVTRAHHDQKFHQIQSSINAYLYSFLLRKFFNGTILIYQKYPTLTLKYLSNWHYPLCKNNYCIVKPFRMFANL